MDRQGTRRAGRADVRRRLAGRSRPVPRGVLAVDPERRHTGVLVGVTLLAVLVGTTAVAGGVAQLGRTADTATTYTPGMQPPPVVVQDDADLQGSCAGTTASGTWTLASDAGAPLRVVLLSDAGDRLGAAPVSDDGSWTVPLSRQEPGTTSAVLLQAGTGAVASTALGPC